MRCHHVGLAVVAFWVGVFCAVTNALAGLPSLTTWQAYSDNGVFRFVYVGEDPPYDPTRKDTWGETEKDILSECPESGLYRRIDGSDWKIVWTYKDDLWPGHSGYVSNDGRKVLTFGELVHGASDPVNAVLLFVIERGVVKYSPTYFNDVSPLWWAKRIASGGAPVEFYDTRVEADGESVVFRTNLGEIIRIDTSTGRALFEWDTFTVCISAILLVGISIAMLVFLWKKRQGVGTGGLT